MKSRTRSFFLLAGPTLALAALAALGAGAAEAADENEAVAVIDGKPITRGELETSVRAQLIEIDNNRYQVLEQGLAVMIAERLLVREASARGMTVDELRKVEVVGTQRQKKATNGVRG